MFQLFRTYVAIVSFGCFKNRSGVLCMLQYEPIVVAACWGAVHGGERRSRHRGVLEAGKCEGVERTDPTYACNRRGRPER